MWLRSVAAEAVMKKLARVVQFAREADVSRHTFVSEEEAVMPSSAPGAQQPTLSDESTDAQAPPLAKSSAVKLGIGRPKKLVSIAAQREQNYEQRRLKVPAERKSARQAAQCAQT